MSSEEVIREAQDHGANMGDLAVVALFFPTLVDSAARDGEGLNTVNANLQVRQIVLMHMQEAGRRGTVRGRNGGQKLRIARNHVIHKISLLSQDSRVTPPPPAKSQIT